jgi:hypothetical protein
VFTILDAKTRLIIKQDIANIARLVINANGRIYTIFFQTTVGEPEKIGTGTFAVDDKLRSHINSALMEILRMVRR